MSTTVGRHHGNDDVLGSSLVGSFTLMSPRTSPTPRSQGDTETNTRGLTTDVHTRGLTTDAPTRGLTTDVPTRGITTDVPTRGPTTDVPARGITTDVPTRGPTTDVPTRGITTDVPTRGITTDATTRGLMPPAARRMPGGQSGSGVAPRDWMRQLSVESHASTAGRKVSTSRVSDGGRNAAGSRLSTASLQQQRLNKSEPVNVFRFVYSEAVEKSIRARFRSSAFPPLTRSRAGLESQCEIPRLGEMFQDWVTVRRFRKSNVSQERLWREQNQEPRGRRGTVHGERLALPRIQHLKQTRKRSSVTPTPIRLPPLIQEESGSDC